MKHWNTIVTVSLNILFCTALLWFFTKNAYLRPYLGSTTKELLSGLLLLVSLYANYFILYPKLYRSHISLYWLLVAIISLVAGGVELALGYPFISQCLAFRINEVGAFIYFSKLLLMVFSRNLAFNLIPYTLRDKAELQQFLETEVRIVYQYAKMIDVCGKDNNCQHISVDDIFYCQKNGNETEVHTVEGIKYTRYCTIKYLTQFLGNKEFARISQSLIVPFQHIASFDGETVVMKTMPWMVTPITFKLDSKRYSHTAADIDRYLLADKENSAGERSDTDGEKEKKSPSVPPKEKLDAVLHYIREHPGCRSNEIIHHTSYRKTTMERCLSYLKKQGLIEFSGSKKTGGYKAVSS